MLAWSRRRAASVLSTFALASWGSLAGCGGTPSTSDAALVDAHVPSTDAGLDGGADAGLDAAAPDAGPIDAAPRLDANADAGPVADALAFVATYLGGLAVLHLDGATGALEPVAGSPFDSGAHYYAVAVHPSRQWAYAVDIDAGDLVVYDVASDGALTRRTADVLHVGGSPVTLAMGPRGDVLYVGLSETSTVLPVSIDAADGTPTMGTLAAVTLDAAPSYLVVDASARTLHASLAAGIAVLTLDGTTGAPTEIASSPFEATTLFGGGIAIDPTGALLLHARFALHGLSVAATGDLARLSGSPFAASAGGDPSATTVAFDASGAFAYAIDATSGDVLSFRTDAAAGTVEAFDGGASVSSAYSIAIDPSGRFVYVPTDAGSVSGWARDATTGALGDPIPGGPFAIPGLQPEMVIVPSP